MFKTTKSTDHQGILKWLSLILVLWDLIFGGGGGETSYIHKLFNLQPFANGPDKYISSSGYTLENLQEKKRVYLLEEV